MDSLTRQWSSVTGCGHRSTVESGQRKDSCINTGACFNVIRHDEFALTWYYVGVSVLCSVGLRVPHAGGEVFANFIQLLCRINDIRQTPRASPIINLTTSIFLAHYLKLLLKAPVVIGSKFLASKSKLL